MPLELGSAARVSNWRHMRGNWMRDLQCEEGAPKPGFWFRWMLYLLKATGTAFFLLIIWLSIGLEWRVSPNHMWIDKDRHFLAFYALSLLALVTITKRAWWFIVMTLVILAAGIEVIQPYFGRQLSVLDFLASCAGVFLAFLPVPLWRLRQKFKMV